MIIEKGQAIMEKEIRTAVNEVFDKQAGRINALMKPKFIRCNEEDMTVTVEFPVLEWELNRVGVMHGGIISSTFDFTFGVLSRYFSELNFSPTISLETTYLKPVPAEGILIITAKIIAIGRSITHLSAEGHIKSSGALAAVAKASYFNVDTKK